MCKLLELSTAAVCFPYSNDQKESSNFWKLEPQRFEQPARRRRYKLVYIVWLIIKGGKN